MANKVFQILDSSGATFDGTTYTTSVATIEPGLLVVKDAGASTVGLAAASGSAPSGFAFGTRDSEYMPTTRLYDTGEHLVVVSGHGIALVSADFFTSGSVPTDNAGSNVLYAAASGLMDTTGTNKVARLLEITSVYDPTGGTGTSNSLAKIEFNIVP